MTDIAVSRWERLSTRLLFIGSGYAACLVVSLVASLAGQPAVAVLLGLPLLVLVIGWVWYDSRWRVDTAVLVRRTGQDPRLFLRHWSMSARRVGIVALLVAWLVLLPLSGRLSHGAAVAISVARILLAALVVVGTGYARVRLRTTVGAVERLLPPEPVPAVVGRDLATANLVAGTLEALFPDRSGPAAVVHDGPAAPADVDGRAADAAFWADVVALVDTAGEALPMLESWGATHRRWRLLAPGTTASDASAGLIPGAIITVYKEAPHPPSDAVFERYADIARTGPAVALLAETGGAMLRFDRLRTPADFPPWHNRAAHSALCAVYPATPDTAAALSATVTA